MKFIKIVSLALVATLVFSCSTKEPIIGKWKLEAINIEKAIASYTNQEQRNFVKGMMESAFKTVKGKMKLTFAEDGKFTLVSPDRQGKLQDDKGTWKLSKDNKKLTTTIKGQKESFVILQLNEKELVMAVSAPGQNEMEMTFIHF